MTEKVEKINVKSTSPKLSKNKSILFILKIFMAKEGIFSEIEVRGGAGAQVRIPKEL